MGVIEVNPAMLAAAAESIGDSSGRIDEELQHLRKAAYALQDSWTGEAQAAFDVAHDGFSASMTERAALVREIADVLAGLAGLYSETDLAGQRALGGS
ncbi:WXG100 family type VII secretion target [Microbacterium sp. 3J1]|uniref:WXG100 family type VII secretion target n=1 Tax=Microbacterium sp. 3J1 TaxID=861269 RepID=UPI000AE619B6|nr:WXG100 family type VII secretion target [Microbacterium sp. 3J1]